MQILNPIKAQTEKPYFKVILILVLGFALRMAWRLHVGGENYWTDGYVFFDRMARNILAGVGLWDGDVGWAMRPPVYPWVLAVAHLVGDSYLPAVTLQALFGVGTIFATYLIGHHLFSRRVGLMAAFGVAVYPYFVVHDTALQETAVLAFFATMGTYLLLKARHSASFLLWLAAGTVIAAAVLTRLTVLPFAGAAMLWMVWAGDGSIRRRLLRAAIVFLPLMLAVGGWMVRNDRLVGAPVLSTEAGAQLWMAHNPYTFSRYPQHSIDESTAIGRAAFTAKERQEMHGLGEVALDRWYLHKAVTYMFDRPQDGVVHAARKVLTGYSWNLNPAHSRGVQLVYFFSYGLALATALASLLLLRGGAYRDRWLIYLHYVFFTASTAVYWAHTSHRVYLDVYFIIFGAFTVDYCMTAARDGRLRLPFVARRNGDGRGGPGAPGG
jgi:4-amino-4-deoxy-L-arabinose transferase-like glycosyltransferase